MKKRFRRAAAVLIVISMLLSLAACGSGSGSNGGNTPTTPSSSQGPSMPEVSVRDGVARSTQVTFSNPDFRTDGLQILAIEGDRMYAANNSFEEDGLEEYQLLSFGIDGSDLKTVNYKIDIDEKDVAAAAFRDGCFYLAVTSYTNSPALDYALANEGATDFDAMEIPDEYSEDASSIYELCCVDLDGKEKWKITLDEAAASDYYYVNSIEVTENGVMVLSSEGISSYSKEDGSFIEKACTVKADELTGNLYALNDGRIIMVDDSASNVKINTYDKASGKFTESMTLPAALAASTLFVGKSYDFYVAGDDGIYGANLGSDALAPVVNFVNSDLDVQGIVRVIEIEDGKLVIQVYSNESTLDTYILDPVAPEDVEEKKELTLGGHYIDYEVRSEVISFNKESKDYRIRIIDYSQYNLEDDDYENSTGIDRMNTDIVTGNAPDIMLLTERMPADNYIAKGVFLDLTDKFNEDKGIEKEDFLQNIIDAFKTDGRMYVAVPGFTVTGISGKTKYIGDGKDLTIQKLKEIAAARGIKDSDIFGIVLRDQVLSSAVEFSGDQFIDRETSTCHFDSDEFKELLEFVKVFPEQINDDQYNDYFTQYLMDKALVGIQYINTLYDYEYMTRQLYGDLDVTVTGFPSRENKGPAVAATFKMGINNNTADPDGCWEFVRRFYLPEYQTKMESCLPVSEKAIDEQGKIIIEEEKKAREEYEALMKENDEMTGVSSLISEEPMPEEVKELMEDSGKAGTGAAAEFAADTAAAAEEVTESEDLTGKPVPEEDFNGTHEEYLQYLEDEKARAASGEQDEEVVIDGEEAMQEDGVQMDLNTMPDFNEEDLAKLKAILKGLTFPVNGGSDILNIIAEESGAYFAGQKSVDEVADIIQSRVQVYLKENE